MTELKAAPHHVSGRNDEQLENGERHEATPHGRRNALGASIRWPELSASGHLQVIPLLFGAFRHLAMLCRKSALILGGCRELRSNARAVL